MLLPLRGLRSVKFGVLPHEYGAVSQVALICQSVQSRTRPTILNSSSSVVVIVSAVTQRLSVACNWTKYAFDEIKNSHMHLMTSSREMETGIRVCRVELKGVILIKVLDGGSVSSESDKGMHSFLSHVVCARATCMWLSNADHAYCCTIIVTLSYPKKDRSEAARSAAQPVKCLQSAGP